jgi:hypothetical protein
MPNVLFTNNSVELSSLRRSIIHVNNNFATNKVAMKYLKLIALSLSVGFSFAQEVGDTLPKKWKLKSVFGINGTQSQFVNWNAGGRNNISAIGFINASANYRSEKLIFENDMSLALGGVKYLGASSSGEILQKTDDQIQITSSLGYPFNEKWSATFMADFKTQFLDGFNYPNDSVRISSFMAPGYLNLSVGADYKPNEDLTMFYSPVSSKMTFVQDQTLADQGAFGVKAAEYDATAGELIVAGENFRYELGSYFRIRYNKEIFKNINLDAKLSLFSNYLDRPENIDVNSDILFTFKVNSWFSASLNWSMIYDHDINIMDASGNVGPRLQFKSVLGVGISYSLENFEEKKK